jgi:hypothetical protein
MTKRIVIESPLSGDFRENYRYLLWCCRAVWLRDGMHAIASHMLNPWFMDDTAEAERAAGMGNPWAWSTTVPHWFFVDRGTSGGMVAAYEKCLVLGIGVRRGVLLADVHRACAEAFVRGEWPPHTPGFEVAP